MLLITGCHWNSGLDKNGTTEFVEEFTVVPMTCLDGQTYWLEKVIIERKYWIGFLTNTIRSTDTCIGGNK